MIRLKNIDFTYRTGEGAGLRDIRLTVEEGEFVVLCGRSGCGKTTVTRLINGLIPHFYEGELRGEVIVGDLNVTTAHLSRTAESIGSVFQNPRSQFFNVDTTGELAFGCENQAMERSAIRRQINSAVEALSLEELMDRSIFELSGGEKQQIACGSVYAARPQVYVLDEPSSNMDCRAIERLRRILEKLKSMGKTIVVSEHRLYYLMDLADRFLYMDQGRLVRVFSPEELRRTDRETLDELGLRTPGLSQVAYTAASADRAGGKAAPAGDGGAQKAAVEIKDLRCLRRKEETLYIPELSLPEGAVVAVIGENGAGKSTLAESLCGLQRCKGKFLIRGEAMKAKARTRLCYMVMQDVNHQLFCETVEEEIAMGAPQERRKITPDLLQQMNLQGLEDRHPASLSGGQKQRVAICAAVCAGKEILVYDEPTSGLDHDGMKRLCGLIGSTARGSLLTLIITHDLELVMGCCSHVLRLSSGKVREFYPLDEDGVEKAKAYFI